jgi:hypothetical protein
MGRRRTLGSRPAKAAVDIDAWAKSMHELCADSPVDDETAMRNAIDEHRRQAKAQHDQATMS